MVFSGSQMSEPVSKNVQVAIHAHKQSSLADRHQNQLAKMPNSSQCSQMILSIRHTQPGAGVPSSTSCSKQFSISDTHQNQLAGMPKQHLMFSCSVVSNSLQPHGLQHSRLPCPKLSLGVCTNSCPLKLVMLSNHLIFHSLLLLPSVFPSIRVFSSKLALCIRQPKDQSVIFSISASTVYSGLIGWISLLSKGLSRVFSSTTVEKRKFFSAQFSLQFNSHIRI